MTTGRVLPVASLCVRPWDRPPGSHVPCLSKGTNGWVPVFRGQLCASMAVRGLPSSPCYIGRAEFFLLLLGPQRWGSQPASSTLTTSCCPLAGLGQGDSTVERSLRVVLFCGCSVSWKILSLHLFLPQKVSPISLILSSFSLAPGPPRMSQGPPASLLSLGEVTRAQAEAHSPAQGHRPRSSRLVSCLRGLLRGPPRPRRRTGGSSVSTGTEKTMVPLPCGPQCS